MTKPPIELVEEYGEAVMCAEHTALKGWTEATARQKHSADALLAEIRLRLAELERDRQRLDWLADPDNAHGAVSLPHRCVEANIHDMRAAIDAAMGLRD